MPYVLLALTLLSGAVLVFGILALLGRPPKNGARAGPAAMAPLVFGSVAALMAGLAFLPFALAGKLDDGPLLVVVAIVAVLLAASAASTWLLGARSKGQPEA
ncbi:MAG: hypothetical protein ACR2HN_00600 [Tepidiformaceae bacterium]